MTRLKDTGVAPAGVSGGRYTSKTNTGAADGLVTSPVDAVVERYSRRDYTPSEIRGLQFAGGYPPKPVDPKSPVFFERYGNVRDTMEAERIRRLDSVRYQSLNAEQKTSLQAVEDAIIGVNKLPGKASKSFEIVALPTGNVVVYLSVNYGRRLLFEETLTRVELTGDGEILAAHIKFARGAHWSPAENSDNLARFFADLLF